jgi:uncharacterized membrane protein YkoI
MAKPVVIAAVAAAIAGSAAAWQTQQVQEEQEGLLARAAVSVDAARQTALAAFPGAAIVESEIEEEGGRLIYSFELKVQGQSAEMDVEVDAMTGEMLPAEPDDGDGGEGEDRPAP